jgi:MYXO-CTERM domain-containing protein
LAVFAVAGTASAALQSARLPVPELKADVFNGTGPRGLPTLEDLAIGKISNGDSVFGDTSDAVDNLTLDGYAPGSWSGGDDVYSLNWGGGFISIDLFFTHANGDLDLMVYATPDPTDGNIGTSLGTVDNEGLFGTIPAGKYWIVVDGWFGASNSYKLQVTPTPGAAAVFGLAGLAAAGRRRRV